MNKTKVTRDLKLQKTFILSVKEKVRVAHYDALKAVNVAPSH